jgi:hypothetical protein
MPAPSARRLAARLAVAGTTMALIAGLAAPAAAAPDSPTFARSIDPYASYEGQSTCDPAEKPGVVAFRSLVRAAYSGVNTGGISRACDSGGRSEHKEGRAWDWMLRADVPADAAKAEDLLGWLLSPDEHGNPDARARRLGVMYIIWNRQWWSAWARTRAGSPTAAAARTPTTSTSPSAGTAPCSAPAGGTAGCPRPAPRRSRARSPGKDPFGELESAAGTSTGVRAVGWAIDPDAATFTSVA